MHLRLVRGVGPPRVRRIGFIPSKAASGGAQTVSPGLIDQSAVTFAPQVNQSVSLGLISQTATVFAPQVNQSVSVGLISQAATVFAPQINQSVSPGLISQTATVFTPSITVGAQVLPALIDQSAVVFTPSLLQAQLVSPGLIDQSAVVFTPTINLASGQTVSPGLIDQSGIVFTPTISGGATPLTFAACSDSRFRKLLIHSVKVRNPTTVGATDRYGNLVPTTQEVSEIMRIEPAASAEDIIDRDTRVTRFKIFADPCTNITGLSELVWDSRTLRVKGEPRPFYGRTSLHHYELDAEEIRG